MANNFYKAPFGDMTDVGSGGNVNGFVSDRGTGPFDAGAAEGVLPSAGPVRTVTVNFDETGLVYATKYIPAGAIVLDVQGHNLTGSISAATVGAVDISAARRDDDTSWVAISTAGDVTITGPTAGTVVVTYTHVAGTV